ncbi:MAG: orotidine 5'-phosphate decarboxylase [Candidatus Aenigmarchaeota archaeon]|nr:orotidine 5'-phosphate decarboxylase [Candidatus Aenigmarchaeota archaeon]
MFERNHGIIVACDVTSIEELKRLVLATTDVEGIVGYKLGFLPGLRHGLPDIVSLIKDISDLPVIYDHQKAGTDIPDMGEPFALLMKECSADSAIIFPQAGPKTQEAFTRALQKHGVIPMVGGELSHAQFLAKDGGYLRDEAPEAMYTLAMQHGVRHFVVPGTKPDAIQKYAELLAPSDPVFCIPGIGKQGGSVEEAFRACGEFNAHAIIGRALYGAPDARAAARQFCALALRFD